MLAAIISFFTALPQILCMIQSLMAWVNKVSGNDPQGFIVKLGAAFEQLNQAKTQEEHANAAKAIAGIINGL